MMPIYGAIPGKMVQLGQRNSDAVAVLETPHGATRKELATVLKQHTPTPENQQEEWRPVVGYEGLYEVSSLGRVRRIATRYGNVLTLPRILIQQSAHGYPRVGLSCSVSGKCRTRHTFVHKLVATAFIGPCPAGLQVNHKDLNRANNRADNLEYLTYMENREHAVGFGRYVGENHGRAKLTAKNVAAIRQSNEPTIVLVERYGVNETTIRRARSGRLWAHVNGEREVGD